MPDWKFDFEQEFSALISTTLSEMGTSLKTDINEVTAYAAERTAYLATLVGHIGYEKAVIAERDNIALKAGISTAKEADMADQRMVGIIQGAIAVAAKAAMFS